MRSAFSSTSTSAPPSWARVAAVNPAAPDPRTTTSTTSLHRSGTETILPPLRHLRPSIQGLRAVRHHGPAGLQHGLGCPSVAPIGENRRAEDLGGHDGCAADPVEHPEHL